MNRPTHAPPIASTEPAVRPERQEARYSTQPLYSGSNTYLFPGMTHALPEADGNGLMLEASQWSYLWIEGALSIGFGIIALLGPGLNVVPADFLLAALFLGQACVQLVRSFKTQNLPIFLPGLMSGVTTLILGLIIFVYPAQWVSIRLMVILYLITQGLTARVMGQRLHMPPYTGGLRIAGWIAMACALLALLGWGKHQGWQLALLVGGVLIVTGFLTVALSLRLASLSPEQGSDATASGGNRAMDTTPVATTVQPRWWLRGRRLHKALLPPPN